MDRKEKVLGGLNLATASGIEIGPLCRPLINKAESHVLYVDHTDAENLRRIYASDPNVDIDKIVEIDGVWGERSLKDCLGGRDDFDYVVASHVIEHVPDILGWINEIGQALRPGGRLCLAIPDRRYSFDYKRRSSGLADVIEAFVRKNRRPTPGQVFDALFKAERVDAAHAWEGRLDPGTLEASGAKKRSALQESFRVAEQGVYRDVHCWVFTPSSLLGILAELVDLDLLPFRCASFIPTEPYQLEFFLTLEKLRPDTPLSDPETAARKSFLDARAQLSEIERLDGDTFNLNAMSKLEALDAELRDIKASSAWRLLSQLRSAKRQTVARIRGLKSTGRRLTQRVFGS
jgi:SAM-dependent methyltransferase